MYIGARLNGGSLIVVFTGVCRSVAMAAKLRLVQFCECVGGRQRVGVELGNGGRVVDVTRVDPSIPTDMKTFLEQWETSIAYAAKYV